MIDWKLPPARLDGSVEGTAKFDLSLVMREEAGSIRASIEYSTELFDAATVERMAGHLSTILEDIAAHPEKRISELSLLSPVERDTIVVEWNATTAEYPRDRCIHELVEAQVKKTPGAVAVVFQDQHLTYSELDRRSNQLARRLRSLGAGPDVLVGICVERSLDMVIGLLGVLKAGGAYVPIDPVYPRDRVAHMLRDAACPVILTQTRHVSALPVQGEQIICLDAPSSENADERETRPEKVVGPTNLAYVIYTSGSTGRPKGVEIAHSAFVNFLTSVALRPGFTDADSLLAVTSLSFDPTGIDLWLPLSVGGRVEIADRDTASDGWALRWRLAERRISFMQATPSTYRLLLDAGWEGDRRLRIIVGGEALPPDLADALSERAREVYNAYGPTEATVISSLGSVRRGAPISIGRPIANTQIYILDPLLQPLPIGVAGELHIGGAGLARGYRNNPELTKEKFVLNPFGDGRLYKTGDLAKWRPDGTLEYLGRIDDQVKVRGYRIELGEIEAVLLEHPAIRESVVLAREDVPGDRRLVGYVVARDGDVSHDELSRHVKSKLPDYMIPSAFVPLKALPMTPNGKVNKRALPRPECEAEREYVAPRSVSEEIVAGIWCEVLGAKRVGIHDDFFQLGGQSLLATRVIARCRSALGVNVPLRSLFEHPTVAAFCDALLIAQDSRRTGSDA